MNLKYPVVTVDELKSMRPVNRNVIFVKSRCEYVAGRACDLVKLQKRSDTER